MQKRKYDFVYCLKLKRRLTQKECDERRENYETSKDYSHLTKLKTFVNCNKCKIHNPKYTIDIADLISTCICYTIKRALPKRLKSIINSISMYNSLYNIINERKTDTISFHLRNQQYLKIIIKNGINITIDVSSTISSIFYADQAERFENKVNTIIQNYISDIMTYHA